MFSEETKKITFAGRNVLVLSETSKAPRGESCFTNY